MLTPEFLMDLESRMQLTTENQYVRMASGLWYPKFMKTRSTTARRDILAWLLSTAQIEDAGPKGGKISYDEVLAQMTEYETTFANRGLRMHKSELEDSDGQGVGAAVKWSGDIGAYMSYWPQKQAVKLIQNGEAAASKSYDNVPFFSKLHPVNPQDPGGKTFANLFKDAAASTPTTDPNDAGYPGACPIDDSVTLDVAMTNLSKVVAYIRSIKMPNGVDPRFLKPEAILGPPRLQQRIVQLTNAKFIAQAAASGGGAADVEALVRSFGFVEPTIADELAGDDTTWYIACREMNESEIGGLLYIEREAFAITYYSGGTLPDFNRQNQLEWQVQGRYAAGYGHPYTLFKVKAA